MSKPNNLLNQTFGRLRVIERAESTSAGKSRWKCKCECGNEAFVTADDLKSGHTKSCGCLHREISSSVMASISTGKTGERNNAYRHGGRKTKLYNIWAQMRQRCTNPNHRRYSDWGGRGITVCEEWNDFVVFRDWALSNGYQEGLSIDRKDNDKGYSPDNCRWSTSKEQNNNKRKYRRKEQ